MNKLVFPLLLFLSIQTHAAAPDFSFFCTQFLQKQASYSEYETKFDKMFQKNVSLEIVKSVFLELYSNVGQCTSFDIATVDNNKYALTLHGDSHLDALFAVVTDEASGLIIGLRLNDINDPSVQIQSWTDLESILTNLDPQGKLSATLTTSDKKVNLVHNGTEVFAIGSTFKLYILGSLVQSINNHEHTWDEILPLKEEWKSLPSGVMQDWPAGKELKLYEYAEKMISISDNTATDHLLYFLGRNNVEKMIPIMGNSHELLYLPLLSTLEMFKLKWAINPIDTQNYLKQNQAERNQFLNLLSQVPRSQVGTNGIDLDKPTLINQLEWYATTPENCDAMFWLATQNSSEVRSILSKNVPFITDAGSEQSHWSYAGYKGGSEPGVLSMTFLLESKKGNRSCFSISWNNQTENVSQYRLMDIVKKTLKYAETQVP